VEALGGAVLGFARLHKVPAAPDGTRPARPAGRPDFDRRRYALFCLTLAALDEAGTQTTLANLARLVEELSRDEGEIPPFDPPPRRSAAPSWTRSGSWSSWGS